MKNYFIMAMAAWMWSSAAELRAAEVESPSNPAWKRRTWLIITDGLKGQSGATGYQDQVEGFFVELGEKGRLCKTARNQSDDLVDGDGKGFKTMAGVTSILTGVGMSTHGVGANDDQSWLATAQARWYTSFLKQAKSCGLQTASVGALGSIDVPDDGKYGAIDQECGWNTTALARRYGKVGSTHCSLTLRASPADSMYFPSCSNGDVSEDAAARRYSMGFIQGCYPYTSYSGKPECSSLDNSIDASADDSACTEITNTYFGDESPLNILPDIVISHMHRVDGAGHDSGWDGHEFDQAVTALDSDLEATLALIKKRAQYYDEEWLIIATSDHGGTGTNHGEHFADRDADSRVIFGVGVIQPDSAAGWKWGAVAPFSSACVSYSATGNVFGALDPAKPRNTHAIHLIDHWMGLARDGFPTDAQAREMDKQLDASPDSTLSDGVAKSVLTAASPAHLEGELVNAHCVDRFTLVITVADVTNAGTDDPVRVRINFADHDTADSEEAGASGWIELNDSSRNDFERAGTYRFSINANVNGDDPGVVRDVSLQLAGTDGIIIDRIEVIQRGSTQRFIWDPAANKTVDNSDIYTFTTGNTGHSGGFWE